MRILLVAYEFLPSNSPQSLRWGALSACLTQLGHEVHVMTPARSGRAGVFQQPDQVWVHRVSNGWLEEQLWKIVRWKRGKSTFASSKTAGQSKGLNWKGYVFERVQSLLGYFIYPDIRGAWRRPALAAASRILNEIDIDVVISSHEPATTLQVGRMAKSLGYKWIADLGDPVQAIYTPWRWRGRAFRLERDVVAEADHLFVTAQGAKGLLDARHELSVPVSIVTQGFHERASEATCDEGHGPELNLFYSGSFYSFRDPMIVAEAVVSTPGVRLQVASRNPPVRLQELARTYPDKIDILGLLTHDQVLAVQAKADVLLNISNGTDAQVPGKFFEYLGACRPILDVGGSDEIVDLLQQTRRGISVAPEFCRIKQALCEMVMKNNAQKLDDDYDLALATVRKWSWHSLAEQVSDVIEGLSAGPKPMSQQGMSI